MKHKRATLRQVHLLRKMHFKQPETLSLKEASIALDHLLSRKRAVKETL